MEEQLPSASIRVDIRRQILRAIQFELDDITISSGET